MPARAHSWLIAASTPPAATVQQPASSKSSNHAGRSKVLTTIVEVDEEEELGTGSSVASWEVARFLSLENASMIPQALLVDASTTLCAYLYSTSLQTRMALQQQASLDILQTVCGSFAPDSSNPSMMSVCAHAVAHHQALQESVVPTFVSHHLVILAVVLKALFGFSVLKFAGKYIKPFDYLVASGAAHCLLLYCFLFAPVANLLENIAGADHTLLYTVASKLICILLIGAAFGLMHHLAVVQRASSRAVALPMAENEPLLSEKSADDFA